jgi:hypothetical protein
MRKVGKRAAPGGKVFLAEFPELGGVALDCDPATGALAYRGVTLTREMVQELLALGLPREQVLPQLDKEFRAHQAARRDERIRTVTEGE